MQFPKADNWSNVVFIAKPDGSIEARIGSVSTANQADVIGIVANANANMAGKIADLAEKGLEKGAAAAAKGATGGVAP